MNSRLATAIVAAFVALGAGCGTSDAPHEYSGKAVTLRMVDKATGEPVADVIGVAVWEMETHVLLVVDPLKRVQIHVAETVSGADGVLRFEAWGPKGNPWGGGFLWKDPEIHIYKQGYAPERLNNPMVGVEPTYQPVRASKWDGSTIFLKRASIQDQRNGLSAVESGLYFAYYGGCEWKRFPRMTAALVAMKQVSVDEAGCRGVISKP